MTAVGAQPITKREPARDRLQPFEQAAASPNANRISPQRFATLNRAPATAPHSSIAALNRMPVREHCFTDSALSKLSIKIRETSSIRESVL